MNTRQKGRKHEINAKKTLKNWGYDVILTHPPQRFKKKKDGGNDFFGLFDLIAIKGDVIRFIQVKSNKDSTGRKWKLAAKRFLAIAQSSVEIWVYKDRVKDPQIKLL